MKFPTRVSSGGRSYVAMNQEQLDKICRVLAEQRYADAERLFYSWDKYQAANPPVSGRRGGEQA